jgi:GT2 family glycosyltransferase
VTVHSNILAISKSTNMSISIGTNSAPSIGVVVVNWNGWQNTLNAYKSLVACDCKSWKLIIVDNASTDDSRERLSDLADTVLISSPVNLGFAGGCNLGIAKIRELGLDYIFLLNSDATVSKDALNNLVLASLRIGSKAALGSVVRYWPSGELQFFGSRKSPGSGRPDWYKEPADASVLNSELIKTDFIFGAALFAPVQIFDEIGIFDERFFLTFEETDWCYRAAAAGIANYVVSNSLVYHQNSASLGHKDAPLQTYFLYRNRLLFYDKHASVRQRIRGYLEVLWFLLHRLKRDLKLVLSAGGSIDPSTKALALAMRDYMLRRFGDCPLAVRHLAQLHCSQLGKR